ncbi:tripartite tricarboxylate transporter TctB family protein [Schlegelella sp. S2-27]|uniref:Tripartite tricarboxylate transporter TctB family protein n=1 Tax=Caldimonas mangrovi TaxID=2944811 RepID=A0ABT0YGZ6_9BURK|nr:tripartite tricarboxylate transporter TctB family protein [Caldimonas mangrovi]MCM5677980.1 tripartite tricarboxylate transporter TctB family protein [Caldimonas mangrovi]
MKIKSQRDFVAGLAFVVVGLAFAWGATSYTFGSSARPGPGYFPFGLGIILAILGAIILFEALTIETEDGEPIGKIAWRPLLVILGAVGVYGFALPRLGIVLTIPVLIGISNFAAGKFHALEVAILSVVLALGSYLVFITGLGLVIPVWPSFVG